MQAQEAIIRLSYRRILVPYDISTPADKALDCAAGIALNTKAEIILLHVVEIPIIPMVELYVPSRRKGATTTIRDHIEAVYKPMQKYAMEIIEEKRERVASRGIQIRTKVVLGKPVEKILEFAKSEMIDLMVLGNIGFGRASLIAALGSVSRAVAERASCPVIVVH